MLAADARNRVSLIDHTADLGIEVEAPSFAALLETAALGMVQVMVDPGRLRAVESRRVTVAGGDREMLLVGLLREVLYLYDTARWLCAAAEVVVAADQRSLTARLDGEPFDGARHEIATEIKAVTYHGLEVREQAGRWRATVILDL